MVDGEATAKDGIELALLTRSGKRILRGIRFGLLGIALILQLGDNVEPVSDELDALVVALRRKDKAPEKFQNMSRAQRRPHKIDK